MNTFLLSTLLLVFLLPNVLSAQKNREPVLMIQGPVNDTLYWYSGVPLKVSFLASTGATIQAPEKVVATEGDKVLTRYEMLLNTDAPTPEGTAIPVQICAGIGSRRYCGIVYLALPTPTLIGAYHDETWPGCRARVGEFYDPSTHWAVDKFPESWYQTRVWFNGSLVFDHAGTRFADGLTQFERESVLTPAPGTRIRTAVYFKPGGTSMEGAWAPLLDTDAANPAAVHPCKDGVKLAR